MKEVNSNEKSEKYQGYSQCMQKAKPTTQNVNERKHTLIHYIQQMLKEKLEANEMKVKK
jgi:hypothetical protein